MHLLKSPEHLDSQNHLQFCFCQSTDSFSNDFHCILECLNALAETIDDLILCIETLIHLMLESLPQSHELSHGLSLEFFDILVLPLKLPICLIFECTKFQRLVCALIIYLLLEVVLAIVHLLHDVLLTFYPRLNLAIKLILQT